MLYLYCQAKSSINQIFEIMEKSEIEKELRYLEIIMKAYNISPELRNREGADEYIDSILDRYNELKKMLNNPSE